jgi:CRP/FNR family transcriptional regulator
MHMQRLRPIILQADQARDACADCEARHRSICHAIDDVDLAQLSAAAVATEFERGKVFIHEGDPATDFFNVIRGTVKLFKLLPDGRQQITGFAGLGYFLGLAAMETYSFSAEAIEPVRACRFSRPKLRRLLTTFQELEHRLLATACNELATAQEQMLLLGRKTARERVASFLVARLADASPCGHSEMIRLPMKRGEIADYLGLTIETVSRVFSRFKSERRIDTPTSDTVLVLDRRWLEDVAAGTA